MTRAVMISWYVCRRKRDQPGEDEDEYVYDVWCIVEYVFVEEDERPTVAVDPELSGDAAAKVGERLREAVDDVMAGRVEAMVWPELSGEQAADLVASLPDTVKSLAGEPLDILAVLAGLPAPAASFGTDVITTALLAPVLEPVERAIHFVEVAAVVIGLLTGMPGLVIICVKHLARDELGSALSRAFGHLLSQAGLRAAEPAESREAPAAVDPGTDSGASIEELPEATGDAYRLAYLDATGMIARPNESVDDEPSWTRQPLRFALGRHGPLDEYILPSVELRPAADAADAADAVGEGPGFSALG